MLHNVIHEGIHAMLQASDGDISPDEQHNEMSTDEYRQLYMDAIEEYNSDAEEENKVALKPEDIEDLSWIGLQKTKEFKRKFKDKEEREKWNERVYKLFFRQTIFEIKSDLE